MVEGVNGQAEKSIYAYNGLGALMENTWIIAKNGYGYHDVDADEAASPASAVALETPEIPAAEDESAATEENALTNPLSDTLTLFANNGNNNGKGNGNKDKPSGSDVKKTSTVVKQFVVDFSRPDFKALQEHEVNGLDYRYVNSDKARLSVVVQGIETGSASLLDGSGELHAYYHTDYLGTTDYLTSAVNSKVISWTNYNEWGEITHNAVLKCGARELDLVKEYATHDYDAVLQMYYAKARMYDAYNRRFTAVDPVKGNIVKPLSLSGYLYVLDNPLSYVDLDGRKYSLAQGTIAHLVISAFATMQFPTAITDTYIYGVTRTKSNRGRPDIVIQDNSKYHVYEIKSDQYISGKYAKAAFNQLNSYVSALNSGNQRNNANYPLQKAAVYGTILAWDNHIILPYIADAKKVIEAWTNQFNPGMIYYKIRDMKKKDEVKSEKFVTDALRAKIGYYAKVVCEDAPEFETNLVGVDNYTDKQLNEDILNWLSGVKNPLKQGMDPSEQYVRATFPDGTVRYHLQPIRGVIFNYENWGNTPRDLLKIYDCEDGWSSTMPTVNPSINGTLPVVPGLVNPSVPAIKFPSFQLWPSLSLA